MRPIVDERDAFEWLACMKPEFADLVITDPPYASLEKHRKVGTTTRLKKEWFEVMPDDDIPVLMDLLFRVLKPKRHCYIMSDDESSDLFVAAGRAAGFHFWKRIVWDKINLGMGYHYRNCHEFVLFFEKGKSKRQLNDKSNLRSIQSFKSIRRGAYPTEKPVELIDVFIRASTEPGELVIDPFCGSGSTGVSALGLLREVLLCDNSPAAVEVACARIAGYTDLCDEEKHDEFLSKP